MSSKGFNPYITVADEVSPLYLITLLLKYIKLQGVWINGHFRFKPFATPYTGKQGCNWVSLSGGRRYIYNRKHKIIHGLSPSGKYVAPLFEDESLAKVWNAGGGARPLRLSRKVRDFIVYLFFHALTPFLGAKRPLQLAHWSPILLNTIILFL